jgi:hypothetical protein
MAAVERDVWRREMANEIPRTPEAAGDTGAEAVAEDGEAKLAREIRERVDTLTDPAYHDASVTPLSIPDYVWLSILCGVIPIALLIWGWFQL